MSKNDIKQNDLSRQPLNSFEKMALINHQLSPAFIVNLRESVAKQPTKGARS